MRVVVVMQGTEVGADCVTQRNGGDIVREPCKKTVVALAPHSGKLQAPTSYLEALY